MGKTLKVKTHLTAKATAKARQQAEQDLRVDDPDPNRAQAILNGVGDESQEVIGDSDTDH